MSAGSTASIEETQPARKAAPLSRSLPSLLNMLHKRWPSMKADACLYSFRFVLLLERISVQSVRCIWRFSRFAVRHCKAEASLYSFQFVSFLERIPNGASKRCLALLRVCCGSLPGWRITLFVSVRFYFGTNTPGQPGRPFGPRSLVSIQCAAYFRSIQCDASPKQDYSPLTIHHSRTHNRVGHRLALSHPPIRFVSFLFWNEYPWYPVRVVWHFSGYAVDHCKAEASLYSFQFVSFLERIPNGASKRCLALLRVCCGSLPGWRITLFVSVRFYFGTNTPGQPGRPFGPRSLVSIQCAASFRSIQCDASPKQDYSPLTIHHSRTHNRVGHRLTLSHPPIRFSSFLFWNEYPMEPVKGVWPFYGFAVGHCHAGASLYSFRFVFILERIPLVSLGGLSVPGLWSPFSAQPPLGQFNAMPRRSRTIHHSLFTIHELTIELGID
jgi:hypothetical protein